MRVDGCDLRAGAVCVCEGVAMRSVDLPRHPSSMHPSMHTRRHWPAVPRLVHPSQKSQQLQHPRREVAAFATQQHNAAEIVRMPLIQNAPDALPYVDAPVSAEALHAANALIQAEIDPAHANSAHPSIPALRQSKFSELVDAEHARIAAGQPKSQGLDLSRYELLDPPAKGDVPAWNDTLQKAYASAEYLRGREVNLGLLETYGKNAWLIGNSQLEDELKAVEKELDMAKIEQEQLEESRRKAQGNAAAELQGLEEAWKTGVGRMIETQAAAERLRLEILQRKRQGVA